MSAQRKTKTEEKLQHAIARLFRTKGIAATTVSDICREAQINRGTFYSHYVDKYDLIDKQIQRLVDDLNVIVLDSADTQELENQLDLIPQQRVKEALEYVVDNFELVSALTENGTNMQLREQIQGIIGTLLERSAQAHGLDLNYGGVPEDYGREMALSGITAVIWHWLKKGCLESPEEIVSFVWTNKSCSPEELLTGTTSPETHV